MRKKIIGSHIALILLMALGFVWIIQGALNRSMEGQYERQLVNETVMARSLYRAGTDWSLEAFAEKVNRETGARVTLIGFDGAVLVDTEKNPSEMDNHKLRDEIKESVLTNDVAVATRYSETIEVDHMYVAVPIEGAFILRLSMPLVEIKQLNGQIFNYAIVAIVIATLVATLLAVFTTKKITDPIYTLTRAAEEIQNGHYGKKIYSSSKDQIGRLTEAFNAMSLNLKDTMTELQNRNIELESILNSMINGVIAIDGEKNILLINPSCYEILGLDSTYVKQGDSMYKIVRNDEIASLVEASIEAGQSQVKEIHYAHLDKVLRIFVNPVRSTEGNTIGSILVVQDVTQMRKLEQMRSDFVSNVSHELKTPLTSIKGFVETLKNGALQNEETAKRFLEIIEIESDRLYRLINDILSLSEIEKMAHERDVSSVYMKELIQEVVDILSLSAEEKGIELKYRVEGELTMSGSRDRLKQLLINLVDNAIKYTETGYVEITAKKTPQGLVLRVKDTGMGFDASHKERLFERFYRVDKGRSRNKGGTGLGLSIVKHIVLLYNGQIYVESTPNEGTQFEIVFKDI